MKGLAAVNYAWNPFHFEITDLITKPNTMPWHDDCAESNAATENLYENSKWIFENE